MKALQIPVTLYIYTNPYAPGYTVSTAEGMEIINPGYVLLDTQPITVSFAEPEPIDIIGKQVANLRTQKERIAAESHRQQSIIDDKIQQLLCIDHSPVDEHEFPF